MIDAYCAANPAPASWQSAGAGWFDPAAEPVEVTYVAASYRVWPHAYSYSRQLGTAYHWYWSCLLCGHTTKDLIPTREMAVDDAENHVAWCAGEED